MNGNSPIPDSSANQLMTRFSLSFCFTNGFNELICFNLFCVLISLWRIKRVALPVLKVYTNEYPVSCQPKNLGLDAEWRESPKVVRKSFI